MKHVNTVHSTVFADLQRSIGLPVEHRLAMTGHNLETVNPVSASHHESGDDFSSSSV